MLFAFSHIATLKKKYLGVVQDLECTKEQKKRLESQVKELSEELQQATGM